MAGGEGRRLRPLTSASPKPLAEIGGIPVIERILRLISSHGVDEAAITVRYLGEMIENRFGEKYIYTENGEKHEIKLKYFTEKQPLGTAGGVKNAEEIYREEKEFLVISGDAMTDLNISDMLAFHRRVNADVTIAVSTAIDPREYGTVLCDRTDGRILRFIEKPSWQQVVTDCVNTGIYIISPKILQKIRIGESVDFSKDIFPAVLKSGGRLFGYEDNFHWCDIGSISDYYSENMRISHGENVFSSEGNISISDKAYVSASVIGHAVTIGDGSFVKKSVVCEKTTIGKNVEIGSGCVIGPGCIIEDNAIVAPNSRIESGSEIKADTVTGSGSAFSVFEFDTNGLVGSANPASCASFGLSLAAAAGTGKRVAVLHGDSDVEQIAAEAVLCGLSYGGCHPYNCGAGFEAMAYFAAVRLGMDYTVFLRLNSKEKTDEDAPDTDDVNEVKIHAEIFDVNGLHPGRGFERKLSTSLGIMSDKKNISIRLPERCSDLESLYLAALRKEGLVTVEKGEYKLPSVFLKGKPSYMLSEVLDKMGFDITDIESADLIFDINNRGDSLVMYWRDGVSKAAGDNFSDGYTGTTAEFDFSTRKNENTSADMWHLTALLAREELKMGNSRRIAIPHTAPIEFEKIMKGDNVTVVKYLSCPSDDSDIEARYVAGDLLWMRDACFSCVKLCKMLLKGKSISEIMSNVPKFFSAEKNFEMSNPNGTAVMKKIGTPCDEGIRIDYRDGSVVRIISDSANSLRIIADASSAEVANELIELSKSEIEKLIAENNNQ